MATMNKDLAAKSTMSTNGAKLRFRASATSFAKIPGSPIAYWVSEKMIKAFEGDTVVDFFESYGRFKTCNDELYLRLWWEVSNNTKDWHPYLKGGDGRNFYGNHSRVLNWKPQSQEFYRANGGMARRDVWNREGITWGTIITTTASFRLKCAEWFNSSSAQVIYPYGSKINNRDFLIGVLGYLNTNLVNGLFSMFNQTASLTVSDVMKVPLREEWINSDEILRSSELISIASTDWDEYETSWDFNMNPLVVYRKYIKGDDANVTLAEAWQAVYARRMADAARMKSLEEENNRLFIAAYGLEDELSPDVAWKDVSLTGNPFYRYKVDAGTDAQTEVPGDLKKRALEDAIKELVSYAIGCLMGRYSLDSQGLVIASQGETLDDYWKKLGVEPTLPSDTVLVPDDDGIIPVIAGPNAFTDNAMHRVAEFVKVAFGRDNLSENLNFIEDALGKSLEDYLAKDFWKDHKKTYKNRPIYWLFSSKRGAFQCLVYMHRMDAYTATRIRNAYLLPHIDFLQKRIAAENARADELAAREKTALRKMQAALDECLEYNDRLQLVADKMQAIDLDDGVAVNYPKFGDVLAKLK